MQIQTVLRLTMVAATVFCVQSCGGASDGGTQPNGTNSAGITLTLFPSTATARQAGLTVVVARRFR